MKRLTTPESYVTEEYFTEISHPNAKVDINISYDALNNFAFSSVFDEFTLLA